MDTCLKCSVWGWKINGTSLEFRIWGTKIGHSRRVPVEPLNPSLWEFRFRPKTENQVSGVASTIFLALGEQQYFYLGRHFSKHKMTGYATKLGWHGPLTPLATPMDQVHTTDCVHSSLPGNRQPNKHYKIYQLYLNCKSFTFPICKVNQQKNKNCISASSRNQRWRKMWKTFMGMDYRHRRRDSSWQQFPVFA